MIWCSGISHREPCVDRTSSCQGGGTAAVNSFGDATPRPLLEHRRVSAAGTRGAKRAAGAWTGMGPRNGGPPRSTNSSENHSQSKTSRELMALLATFFWSMSKISGLWPSHSARQRRGAQQGSWSQGGQKAMPKPPASGCPETSIAPRGWQGTAPAKTAGLHSGSTTANLKH